MTQKTPPQSAIAWQHVLFRQLFDPDTSTYTYLIADTSTQEAVLIDPVREQVNREVELLGELDLKLVATLDTHAHADHVTGADSLRKRLGSEVIIAKASGADNADRYVEHGDTIEVGGITVEVRATPGHTSGCVTYVMQAQDAPAMAFTGDALLIRGCGRTDFQQGDSATLYNSVHEQVFTLPDDTLIYPGHDYKGRMVSTVREERRFNPRLGGGRSEAEFCEIMAALDLPFPRRINEALPANMRCGGSWAPVRRTEGAPEVSLNWVRDNRDRVRLVDVRAPEELEGPLGHIPGSLNAPLPELTEHAKSWDRNGQYILICRSGRRSLEAARILEGMGFTAVASMDGGMAAWTEGEVEAA